MGVTAWSSPKGMPEATPRRVVRPLLTEEDVARIAAGSEVLDGEL